MFSRTVRQRFFCFLWHGRTSVSTIKKTSKNQWLLLRYFTREKVGAGQHGRQVLVFGKLVIQRSQSENVENLLRGNASRVSTSKWIRVKRNSWKKLMKNFTRRWPLTSAANLESSSKTDGVTFTIHLPWLTLLCVTARPISWIQLNVRLTRDTISSFSSFGVEWYIIRRRILFKNLNV